MRKLLPLLLVVATCATAAAAESEKPGQVPGTLRIKFQAYDGDVRAPAKMEFQINSLDAGARTEFVRIGDTIPNTSLKVAEFVFKEAKNPVTGEKEDVSELKVKAPTGEGFVLILNKVPPGPAPKK